MFKQLNAGIVSLGLMSTMTSPLMAQSVSGTSTEANSVPTNNLLVEDYSNLYSIVPQVEGELNTLAVKNTLDFSDIGVGEQDIAAEDFDLLSQRRTSSLSKYKYTAGFDFVSFGWVKDRNGAISSTIGFNIWGLGFGYKKYFKPAQDGKFNLNFGVHTIALIIPGVSIGVDYQWEQGWYLGAAAFSNLAFLFIPLPTVVGGYRWK